MTASPKLSEALTAHVDQLKKKIGSKKVLKKCLGTTQRADS